MEKEALSARPQTTISCTAGTLTPRTAPSFPPYLAVIMQFMLPYFARIDPLNVLHTIFQCNSIGIITTEELFSSMLYREKLRPRGEAVVCWEASAGL